MRDVFRRIYCAPVPLLSRETAVLRLLDHIGEWLMTLLIGVATLVIFIAVMHRYGSG